MVSQLVAILFLAFSVPEPADQGLMVESVNPRGAAALAGVQAGDRLLGWSRESTGSAPASGTLVSPLDMAAVAYDQAPRGPITLEVVRADDRLWLRLPPGGLEMVTWPRLLPAERAHFEAAALAPASGFDLEPWRRQATAWATADRESLVTWMWVWLATTSIARGDHATASTAAEEAWADPTPIQRAVVALQVARAWQRAGDPSRALHWLERACEDQQRLDSSAIVLAHLRLQLGRMLYAKRDPAAAVPRLQAALEQVNEVAHGSFLHSRILNTLAATALADHEPIRARGYLDRGLEILRRVDPEGRLSATTLTNLGLAARQLGDLAAAEGYYLESLRLRERYQPRPGALFVQLNNLGVLAHHRGDLESAEQYFRRAESFLEQMPAADLFGLRSLSLRNLAEIARDRGDLDNAANLFAEALALESTKDPRSAVAAAILRELGVLERRSGDLEAAEQKLLSSLEIGEEVAPESLDVAATLDELGLLGLETGRLDDARRHLERALALQDRKTPESGFDARTRYYLALVAERQGRHDEALGHLLDAVHRLERRQRRIGRSDRGRVGFASQHAEIYAAAIDQLVTRGRTREAYGMLELSRARGLVSLLGERDAVSGVLAPDLEKERRRLHREHDRLLAALEADDVELGEKDRSTLLEEWRLTRHRLEGLIARVRTSAPEFASLRYPSPQDFDQARASLDDGTVALAYSVSAAGIHLFVLRPEDDRPTVFRLEGDASSLERDVERLRIQVEQGFGQGASEAMSRWSRRLSERLLGPAKETLEDAQRLLILPDGPLHGLSFALLRDPARPERYLIESKPLHVAASLTVYAQLRERRGWPASDRVVAFGDPLPPEDSPRQEASQDAGQQVLLRRFQQLPDALPRLPSARDEAETLASLFPEHAEIHLGSAATEERVKSLSARARIVHFACHGLVDDDSPLESALLLSVPSSWQPDRENGLLEAWEVIEELRVDADLVTLSACGSGLGRRLDGEGRMGLTRAFHFAGARTVLAALWNVADETTAALMRRFYGYLRDGATKDEALRRAQVELLRGEELHQLPDVDSRHPFFWASFQVTGDWR